MPPFPIPAPLAVPGPPIIHQKPKRKPKTAVSTPLRNGNNNPNHGNNGIINLNPNQHMNEQPPTPSTTPSTWSTTARKRLDAKMLSLKDHTVPQPNDATLQIAIEKLRYFIIRALHPNLRDMNKGGDNSLGLVLRRQMNIDGYMTWLSIQSTEGDEATRRLAQVWFFYKMAEILNSFCDDEKRRGEGANDQGRLQRGYDKLIPICKRILDTDNRQYIRNLICSSKRFRQLCIHMVGVERAELFVFFKGELTLTDLKDMTASAAKMDETTAMLDVVLDDYSSSVEAINVGDGDLTGVRIDMWNGILEI
ncbi:hypothetical protein DFP73DRAFT_574429 [Morchella snyderi]|nr:hypothetical protein DFP73DRAFT_574429 [Morchella snyderi]